MADLKDNVAVVAGAVNGVGAEVASELSETIVGHRFARSAEFMTPTEYSRDTPTNAFVLSGAFPESKLNEELRRLLRERLLLVHLLALACSLLLALLIFLIPRGEQEPLVQYGENYWWGLLTAQFAEGLIGAIILWRSSVMSLWSLRTWELIFFGVHAATSGIHRFEALATPLAGAARTLPMLSVGFSGLRTLEGFVVLILAYGVLIPNTRRRSLTVVAALAAIPLAIVFAAAVVNPALRQGYVPLLIVQSAVVLTFPAAIAVFSAARAAALQRRAFEAERRAEQIDQYTLKQKIGDGGMGDVWLAEHRLLKRPCVVKFIRPELAADPATASRFAREVHAVTGLTHLNTVRVYDYGQTEEGSFYFVMEYLDGPTLEELVSESGPLSPGRVVYLFRQLCGALAEAHAAGLVHRDLKPGNVIVVTLGGQPDVVKLLDFGLVQDLSADTDGRLTRTGTILGTPAYMSPEQAAGEAAVDARGDVYGLGAAAFFALIGRPPFQEKSLGRLLAAHRSDPAPFLTDLQPDTPVDLTLIIARCLAKDPNERFQSVTELDRALSKCECAADWSTERAGEWWQSRSNGGNAAVQREPESV